MPLLGDAIAQLRHDDLIDERHGYCYAGYSGSFLKVQGTSYPRYYCTYSPFTSPRKGGNLLQLVCMKLP